ncbi:serine/threonine-protein kinase HipA [Oxalobacteraceae bacterium GrIS 1.18]
MMMNKSLFVHTTQGPSGVITKESQYIFNYRTKDKHCEIGLTMPLTAQSYASSVLPGAMRQNLPEGFLLGWIREKFCKTMKINDFNILTLTGRNTIGRVQCLTEEISTSKAQEGEDLKELLTWKGTEDLFDHLAEKYALLSGISGVQPKVLVPQKSALNDVDASLKIPNLIVKSSGYDYPGLAENEYHCMMIAKKAGLVTPRFWLSDDKGIFVIERFDIDRSNNYLGFEDMTSLTGCQNDEKYNSSSEIVAKVLKSFCSGQFKTSSLTELFKSIVLSVAVRNGDAHLKNFGLLYTDPTTDDVQLSPLYDIVNTTSYLPKDVMALKLAKTKSWPYRNALIEFGKQHCDIDNPDLIIDSIVEAAHAYVPEIEPGVIWDQMRAQIEIGCSTLAAAN